MTDSSSTRSPKTPHTSQRLLIFAALIAVLAGLGFVFTRRLIDFPVYYAAGRSLIGGRTDLYAPDFALGPTMGYPYPPLFLVLFIPLLPLPFQLASYIWYLLSVIAVVICCWATARALSTGRKTADSDSAAAPVTGLDRTLTLTLGVTLIGVAEYYVMALHYGNAQLIVTALLLLALLLAIHGRNLAPAALLAFVISIKITPALFLAYFALNRRWKLVITTTVLVAALNLAPALYFGFTTNARLIETWYRHVLVEQEFHEVNGPINLSLKGQLVRSLTRVDYRQRVDGDTSYPGVNFADYSYQ